MRKILTIVLAGLFMMAGGAAYADQGAGAPTPYSVTTEGIQLAPGDTFGHNDQVHIRYYPADSSIRQSTKATGPEGESFISWSAFGLSDGDQVVHVRMTIYTQHWNFDKGIPVGPKPDADSETRTSTTVGDWEREALRCEAWEQDMVKHTYTVTEQRDSTIVWDGTDWIETWGDWYETGREVIDTEHRTERLDPDSTECGMPPTGAGQVAGLAGIALLTLIGGTFLVRRSKA